MALKRTALVGMLLLEVAGGTGRAELPPYVYKERRERAPERLEIKVVSVRTRTSDEPERVRVDVTAEAEVRRVHRSQSGLKQGDVVRIKYVVSRFKEPIAGPSQVPILKPGLTCPAFLVKDQKGRAYAPAAGGTASRP